MTQSKSPAITATSGQLREAVEILLDCAVPEAYWPRAEQHARRKLERAKEMQPDVEYYDNFYLALLTRDIVREMAFSDYTMAVCLERAGAEKEALQ